ncbi:MAG: hypothetical protein CMI35_10785 [Owenweeksia sp.]|nr:hypothetical protein [Owenweeksia sp.]|tara:strand:+ start:1432 stop:2043 length:612 start_codon:yes stop_codon:yes gene_type:complete
MLLSPLWLIAQPETRHNTFIPGLAVGIGDLANRVMYQPGANSSTTFEKRPVYMISLAERIGLGSSHNFIQATAGLRIFELHYDHEGGWQHGSFSTQVNRFRWGASWYGNIMRQEDVFLKGGFAAEHNLFTTAERDWLQLQDFNFFLDVGLAFMFHPGNSDLMIEVAYNPGLLDMSREGRGYTIPVVEFTERFFYLRGVYYPFQ